MIMMININIAQRLQPAASEQEVHWEARAGGEKTKLSSWTPILMHCVSLT